MKIQLMSVVTLQHQMNVKAMDAIGMQRTTIVMMMVHLIVLWIVLVLKISKVKQKFVNLS